VGVAFEDALVLAPEIFAVSAREPGEAGMGIVRLDHGARREIAAKEAGDGVRRISVEIDHLLRRRQIQIRATLVRVMSRDQLDRRGIPGVIEQSANQGLRGDTAVGSDHEPVDELRANGGSAELRQIGHRPRR
jgi:hypothetical protein